MAAVTNQWPTSNNFPQFFLVESYRELTPDGQVVMDSDSGMGRVQKVWAGKRTATGDMDMTRRQVELAKEWHKTTLRNGTLPFYFPNQLRHLMPLLTVDGEFLLDTDGNPIRLEAWWVVRFQPRTPMPFVSVPGVWQYHKISMTLEIYPDAF